MAAARSAAEMDCHMVKWLTQLVLASAFRRNICSYYCQWYSVDKIVRISKRMSCMWLRVNEWYVQ